MFEGKLTTDELRSIISKEVLFSNEATKYLGVSSQRLHQLVQSGKLSPVKSSRSATLFLKSDLDERVKEMEAYATENNKSLNLRFNNHPRIIQEAINYFTIHYLCNHSEKKANDTFDDLNMYIDVSEPFIDQLEEINRLLGYSKESISHAYTVVCKGFDQLKSTDSIVKKGQDIYPSLLAQTENAPRFLFMRGNINLLEYPIISIVGTRNPSPEGITRAHTLATILGQFRIVVASGLAKGIDRAAHEGALSTNKPTIAVIGTPLSKAYPKENAKLQEIISENFLVISQFAPSTPVQRWNFPARNAVMSGISIATVIIEAGETSGSLIQANHALKQGRLVFIPQSALNDSRLNWPKKYIKKDGAFRFSKIEELLNNPNLASFIKNEAASSPIINKTGVHYVHRSD